MIIKCPFCEGDIEESVKFCPHCGKTLTFDEGKQKEGKEAADNLNALTREKKIDEVLRLLEDFGNRLDKVQKVKPDTVTAGNNPSGFKNLSEFFRAVKVEEPLTKGAPIRDERLRNAIAKQMAEGADITGGFTVPAEFYPTLLQNMVEASVIRPYATIIPMKRDQIDIVNVTDNTHVGSIAGIVVQWLAEAAAKHESEPTFEKKMLVAKKLAGYCIASDEWLEDTVFPGPPLLAQKFGEAISWTEDNAFINGTGAGQPLGILNGGALIAVAPVAGQAAATIVYRNIVDMLERLLPTSHKKRSTVWLANQGTLGQLIQMNATIGASGVLVWHTDAKGYPEPVLMGRPVVFTEKCLALGLQGDIILTDLSYYWIGDRTGGVQVATSEHYRFIYDQTTFRFVKRVDGMPIMDTVFTPANGATLSPFVTLQARP